MVIHQCAINLIGRSWLSAKKILSISWIAPPERQKGINSFLPTPLASSIARCKRRMRTWDGYGVCGDTRGPVWYVSKNKFHWIWVDRIPNVALLVFHVHCGTLKTNQSKECECIMEFSLIHFNVLVQGLSRCEKIFGWHFNINVYWVKVVVNFFNFRTYVSIEDGDNTTRPLGFLKATVKFEKGEDNPCVSVAGVLGRGVEIMVLLNN